MASPKPTPPPTLPPGVVAANAAANAAASNSHKPTIPATPEKTKSPAPVVGGETGGLEPIKIGSSEDWNQFLDGSLAPITMGPNGTTVEPYVSGKLPSSTNPNPGAVAILPNASGTGFYTDSVDNVAAQSMLGVNAGNIQAFKLKLQAYYPSVKEFKLSYATSDKDAAFT